MDPQITDFLLGECVILELPKPHDLGTEASGLGNQRAISSMLPSNPFSSPRKNNSLSETPRSLVVPALPAKDT